MRINKSTMSKQGMMERLEWYVVLKRLFTSCKEKKEEEETVQKPKLLQKLAENYLSLHLKPGKDYLESSSIRGLSYDDVWTQIESLPRSFSWDDLLDSLHSLVPSQPALPKKELKTNEAGTLKEDFPLIKFHNLNEISISKNLKFLSLGGNMISNANFEFPSSLIVLNLSYNQISDFLPIRPLVNLKFLNLSNNTIENLQDITGIITILELFISGNRLNQANFFFSIKNLTVLDLANNVIENFEDIALLCTSSKLQTLNLKGNPLSHKQGYKASVNNVVPSLVNFDPEDCSVYSSFKQIGFVDLPQEQKPRINLSKAEALNEVNVLNMEYANRAGKWVAEKSSPVTVNRAASPKTVGSSPVRHQRSKSNMPGQSLPTTPSLNNSRCEGSNPKKKTNNNEKIGHAKSRFKEFGDPVSAMMIGPPAILSVFRSNRSKTMKLNIEDEAF